MVVFLLFKVIISVSLLKVHFPPTVRKELLGGMFGKVQMYLPPFLLSLASVGDPCLTQLRHESLQSDDFLMAHFKFMDLGTFICSVFYNH